MTKSMTWNAEQYDQSFAFVSQFGATVLDWLDPKAGEVIIDLGCGSGDLTLQLVEKGADVIGIDASEDMLELARAKAPKARFSHQDGHVFKVAQQVDAIFSNAALHWMTKPKQVIASISQALRTGGRFVAEFGGKGNIGPIAESIKQALQAHGHHEAASFTPWYFPSISEYSSLLEAQGLEVRQAQLIDRPTLLSGGDQAVEIWLNMFASSCFQGLSAEEIQKLYAEIKEHLRPSMYKGYGQWVAQYRRIRVMAVKVQS